ncbi:MAG: radical SAM protein [Candidatus Omnitrophica bacterium]|nr:radical SAM protein [Candidatus Omnitrophota bacterium]
MDRKDVLCQNIGYLKKFERDLAYHFSEKTGYPYIEPHWVYVSLSHRCTYRCKMCGVVKILQNYELTTERVKHVFDEIAQWRAKSEVVLTGGEPFLRKDIFDIIAYGIRKNIHIESVSNGALIDQELAVKIMSCGLHNIAVSLDGVSPETHDAIRAKGSFDKAVNALRNLVQAKRRSGHGPQISVWTTIMNENVTELYEMIALVREVGVECLVYHPVIVVQENMQNTLSDAPFWITKAKLEILKTQIDKIIEYQKKNGLVAFLHDPYLWLNYFEGNLKREQWKCNPFVFINIGPDGEVRSCGDSFGNIHKMSLSSCLRSEDAYEARILMKTCAKPCLQTCWAHPDADSLSGIIKEFLDQLRHDAHNDKKTVLREALSMLNEYEEKLKQP